MFINAHCHVFNLQAIFTEATVDIFEERLRKTNLTEWLQKDIIRLVRKIVASRSDEIDKAVVFGLTDLPGFVLTALSETMDAVADRLMHDMESVLDMNQDILATPLMMDVLTGEPAQRELEDVLFTLQIDQTRRQILRYPGRMLPFVAVNPKRSAEVFGQDRDAISRMKDCLENQGFVGVKLYPSLGYTLKDLEACGDGSFFPYLSKHQVPITMHTNNGGFKAKDEYWQRCQPDYWADYLARYPGLRINFAHFGGGTCFLPRNADGSDNTQHIWYGQILDLMRAYPGRVYADVSYHDQPWAGGWCDFGATRRAYFRKLAEIMADPAIGPHVLFGSDFFLVMMCADENEYLKMFRKGMAQTFGHASRDNSRRFLGLANSEADMGWAMQRHLAFLRRSTGDPAWASARPLARWLPDDL